MSIEAIDEMRMLEHLHQKRNVRVDAEDGVVAQRREGATARGFARLGPDDHFASIGS